MDYTPKPVYHNGNVFRSTTEHRWALVFEALKIHYLYEYRSFKTEYGRYLPDFYLPNLGVWIEVKGQAPTNVEIKKCMAVQAQTGEPVLILSGRPSVERYHEGLLPSGFAICWFVENETYSGLMFAPTDLYLLIKEKCGDFTNKLAQKIVLSLLKARDVERKECYSINELVEKYYRLIVEPFNYAKQKLTNTKKAKNQDITEAEKIMLKVIETFTYSRVSLRDLQRVVIKPIPSE